MSEQRKYCLQHGWQEVVKYEPDSTPNDPDLKILIEWFRLTCGCPYMESRQVDLPLYKARKPPKFHVTLRSR